MSNLLSDGNVTALFLVTLNLTPASVGAETTAEQTFTVTGLKTTDVVMGVSKLGAQAGIAVTGVRIVGVNQVGITFDNSNVGATTPTAGVYQVLVVRPEKTITNCVA